MGRRYWRQPREYQWIELCAAPLVAFGISYVITYVPNRLNEFAGCWLLPAVSLISATVMFALGFLDQRPKFHAVVAAPCAIAAIAGEWRLGGSQGIGALLSAFFAISVLATWSVSLVGSLWGIKASRRRYTIIIGRPPGTCPSCGYLLKGLPKRVCPECGRHFDLEEVGMTVEELQDVDTQLGGDNTKEKP